MEVSLKCPVCQDYYNLEEKLPRVLAPCSHLICEACLKQTNSNNQGTKVCMQGHRSPQKIETHYPAEVIIEKLKRNS